MSFMILSYNPKYIEIKNLDKLVDMINKKESVPIYLIEHNDDGALPLYSVNDLTFPEEDD